MSNFVLFFSIFFLSLLASGSSQLGTCSTSPIRSADNDPNYITCHARVTYDVQGVERTVNGHIATTSCDPDNVCKTFTGRGMSNPRCTDGFCCRGGKPCNGKSRFNGSKSSISGGVRIMLILSTLVASFAIYM